MDAGIPPPQSRHPPEQTTPQSRHPRVDTPRADTPPGPDPPGADTPPGANTPWEQTPPRTRPSLGIRLQHTVYEQLVRILLECILVPCVCDSVHGGVSGQGEPPGQGDPQAGRTPPGREAPRAGRNPREQTPTPPGRENPRAGRTSPGHGEPPRAGRPPAGRNPPGQGGTPQEQTPPHREADCSIRSMSGRYASYWNAFLF